MRQNNFDILRLSAALLVFFSHLFALYGLSEPLVHSATSYYMEISFGTLGVTIFFIISGYLVTQSAVTKPDPQLFLKARALRILPAYVGCYFLVLLVLGPFISLFSVTDYFAALIRNIHVYLAIFGFAMPDLPGMYSNNAYQQLINGNLWTLFYEVQMYAVIYFLILLQQKLARPVIPAALFLFIAFEYFTDGFFPHQSLDLATIHRTAFLLGSVFYLYRDKIPLHGVACGLWLLALCISWRQPWFLVIYVLAVAYMVIYLATSRACTRKGGISIHNDFSYGIYLYSWPMERTFAQLFPTQFGLYAMGALGATLVLAAASWYLIEKPALRLKRG